ncbi:MAG: TolC family protein [Bacteroidales bacterium]
MKGLKHMLIALAALCPLGMLGAQDNALTLSSALEKAMANNYGIILSRSNADVAGINNDWGNAGRYPTVSFSASDNNSYNLTGQSYTGRLTGGLALNWTLFDGFYVQLTKSRLETLEDLSKGQLAVMVENTVEDVILAYYNVLLQEERLEVLHTVMVLSEDRYSYEQRKKDLGGSVTYDVLQAQNVYLSDKAAWMNQEVVLRNAVRNLNFLLGDTPESQWTFLEEFEADAQPYVLSDLLDRMKASNLTLKNQYSNLMLAENQTERSRSAYYPSLSLGTGIDATQTWTGGGTGGNASLVPYGNLRLSFDIYSAGARKRSVEIARIQEENAQVEIREMEHALTNELFNLHDYYGVRQALVDLARENLAAAELNMSISEEKYKSGVINSFNYRDVQLLYLNASLGRLQAIYNLVTTKTALTRLTGGFLQEGAEVAAD